MIFNYSKIKIFYFIHFFKTKFVFLNNSKFKLYLLTMGCKNSGAAKAEGPTKLDKEAKDTEEKPKAYDRDAEKDQEIGEEFLNPDKDMDEAATKIQQ